MSLSGTGLAGAAVGLSLSTNSLTFPATTVGARSSAQSVTLTNSGGSPVAISLISAGFEFPTLTYCRASLASGESCDMLVSFEPQAAGARSSTLSIASSAPSSPDRVSLSGVGILNTAAVLEARPDSITFTPSIGVGARSAARSLVIANTGSGPANIASISVEGDFAISGSCPSIPAAASCSLSVDFMPTATGTREGMIIVRSNAVNAILAVALEGLGAPLGPEATLGATRLAFGNQFQFVLSPPLSTSLTNTGLASLLISQISASATFVQTNDCGAVLAPGASCQISVRMFGSYLGTASGELRVTSNAAPASIVLSGTACKLYSTLRTQRGLLTCAP